MDAPFGRLARRRSGGVLLGAVENFASNTFPAADDRQREALFPIGLNKCRCPFALRVLCMGQVKLQHAGKDFQEVCSFESNARQSSNKHEVERQPFEDLMHR